MRSLISALLFLPVALFADYRPVPVTERYPLSQMQYQGTISVADPGQTDEALKAPMHFALVKLPNGEVYRLKTLDTLGKHYGRIIRIEPERLYIAEILPSCREPREWIVRMNYINSPATLFNPEYRMRTAECLDEGDIVVTDKSLDCAEGYCGIQFTLHNRLHHPVDVRYSIYASLDTKSENGSESSTNSSACDGVQRLGAKQRVTLKKFVKTQSRLNSVTISPDFGKDLPRDRCLGSKNQVSGIEVRFQR